MSSVSIRQLRSADSGSRNAVARVGGLRREPSSYDNLWSDALAIGSLAALIGIVVLLLWTR